MADSFQQVLIKSSVQFRAAYPEDHYGIMRWPVRGIDIDTSQAEPIFRIHHGVGEGGPVLEFLLMPSQIDEVLFS